jgi:hypothetical protein
MAKLLVAPLGPEELLDTAVSVSAPMAMLVKLDPKVPPTPMAIVLATVNVLFAELHLSPESPVIPDPLP